jgi:hypothetical protein
MDEVFGLIGPHLVVIDPLSMFLSGGGDLRQVLMQLIGLAAEHETAILLTRHLTKELKGRALHRGLGPVGVIGAARTGLLAARDPADPTRCVLVSTKSNLSAPPPPLAYRVADRNGHPVIEWLGRAEVTADDAARGPGRPRVRQHGVVTAADWLATALEGRERPAADVLSEARGSGISERTLDRAKSVLRVEARLASRNGRPAWLWRLPKGDNPSAG